MLSDAYWDAIEHLNSFLPEFNEAGGSMYYYLNPNSTGSSGNRVSRLRAMGGFAGQRSKAEVMSFMQPFVDKLGNISGAPLNFTVRARANAASFYLAQLSGPDQAGINIILGSRLLSRGFMKATDGPKNLTDSLRHLDVIPGDHDTIQGLVTAGPQVWANSGIDSALHPIWRETQLHLIIVRFWEDTTPFKKQEHIQRTLTYKEVPILKKLDPSPKGGAYLNEADAYDPEWKETFWGSNYPRLYQVKQKWDPEGLFIVRTGVGSEHWDNEGLCRK